MATRHGSLRGAARARFSDPISRPELSVSAAFRVSRMSGLIDPDGFEPRLAASGSTEQADAVIEDDRQELEEDLVDQVGLEALLGDVYADTRRFFPPAARNRVASATAMSSGGSRVRSRLVVRWSVGEHELRARPSTFEGAARFLSPRGPLPRRPHGGSGSPRSMR